MSDIRDEAMKVQRESILKLRGTEKWAQAVEFLRGHITEKIKSLIRTEIECDPKNWYVSMHFDWGMSIRNDLRNAGFGEKELGIGNMDDVYVPLVEEAVGQRRFEN